MSIHSAWLAASSAGEILGGAFMTIIIGFVVVFGVLLLLTGVFKLFGVAASSGTKKESKPAAPPAPATAKPAVEPAALRQEENDGEIVAAIAAAVAAMSAADGQRYAIRSIRRKAEGTASGRRPVWSAAGLAESTRPF